MKKSLATISILILSLLIIIGCTEEPLLPDDISDDTIETIFADARDDNTQAYTIDTASIQQIYGTDGTIVTFPPDCFVDQDGNPVTGQVDVQLLEITSKGDMILNNVPSIGFDGTDYRPLITGGSLNITVSQNGKELELAIGAEITIAMPAGMYPDPNMGVFLGQPDAGGTVIWTEAPSNTVRPGWNDNTNTTGGDPGQYAFYEMTVTNLRWVNYDYFANFPTTNTDITINCPTGHNAENTRFFLVYNTENIVMPAKHVSGTQFVSWPTPIGYDIKIVGISKIGDIYYSVFRDITVTDNHVENISFNVTTYDAYKLAVQGL